MGWFFFEFGGLGKEGEVMRVGDWTVDRVEGWEGSFMGRLIGRVYSRLDGCNLLVRVYSMWDQGESSLQAVAMRVRTFTIEKCGGS